MAQRTPALPANDALSNLIGQSEKILDVCRRIDQVAPTGSTILIQGESSTGKELAATAIHFHSHCADRPFIKINCTALPQSLIESELCDHVKGAFTGAIRDRKGRFAEADGGKILLDEIGSIPLAGRPSCCACCSKKSLSRSGLPQLQKSTCA